MSFSNHLESGLLNHTFGAYTYTAPISSYIALSTADPGEDGATLAEPVGLGYKRVRATNNKTTWTYANGGALENAIDLTFPEATGAWGTITHFAIMNDPNTSGAGVILGSAALTVSKAIVAGDTAKFASGDLDITLT